MYAERQDFAKGHEFTRAEEVIPVFSFRGCSGEFISPHLELAA